MTAPSQLEATRATAKRMEGAGGASTRASPRQLLQVVRRAASRIEGAGAAKWRAAPSQSFELPAVCTADSVYRAHRKSSLVKRRRLKLRLGSRTTCESSRRSDGGGELMQRSPQASKCEWQTCPCTRV